ncbi:MAG TPA: hypothetical protein VE591_01520 [Candidatus Acidoferrum sp.]|nr:hypothetical protein [Candidatus Acidoferrum sp.]
MKLLIGIPTSGQPTRPFLDALQSIVLPASVSEVDRVVWTGNFVAGQREMIARDAVRRGFDLLAMIDDDIVVPRDGLERLVAALQADPDAAIAGALYYSRDGARPMTVSRWSSSDTTSAAIPPFNSHDIVPIDGLGFGFVVLRVAALASLTQPYFAAHLFVDDLSRTVRQCDEDYLLCERLRSAGYRVLLHGGVRAGHYDRGRDIVAPERWETDDETDRVRMIVREGETTRLVPFDDRVPQAKERQEPFPTTMLSGSA